MSVETKEVTVQAVLYPDKKIPFARIRTAEEGFISLDDPKDLKEFSVGDVCKVTYKLTDKGFKNNGKRIGGVTAKVPAREASRRPSTSNTDAMHIYVNGKLAAFIAAGKLELAMTDIVEATDLLVDAYYNSKLSGHKAQSSDDLQDAIPFP